MEAQSMDGEGRGVFVVHLHHLLLRVLGPNQLEQGVA